eukprot:CAMPEP_0204521298 /NCGR_PEP_ID=MMETSP0661-20131031/5709_1 /ASSEMBLY_ACC=CAM_ASM_000606 /TAXON_ID=109239 /ORGANISM="Alexandrium margalefi, Strain AMGDE01CS-322" /LENGTH=58 /DNA_ID=CAMNT_0051526883 /DNA_START=16 /DNA_END=188 /DNA_ORIENTATION=+
MDIAACVGLGSGETCLGVCRPPFVGLAFNGSCPADNVDSATELSWSPPPVCDCPDPSP